MKKLQIPTFVKKLDQILETTQFYQIISWTEDGDAFIIKNMGIFIDKVLLKFFKHKNFSSFNRQLYKHQFYKVRNQTQHTYANDNFIKNNKHLYRQIRLIKQQKKDSEKQSIRVNQVHAITKQLQSISKRQQKIQQVCKSIFVQNQSIIASNTKLLKTVNNKIEFYNKHLLLIIRSIILSLGDKFIPNLSGFQLNKIVQNSSSDDENNNDLTEKSIDIRQQKLSSMLSCENLIEEVIKYLTNKNSKRINLMNSDNVKNLCLTHEKNIDQQIISNKSSSKELSIFDNSIKNFSDFQI